MNRRTFLKLILGTPAVATYGLISGVQKEPKDLRMTRPGQTVANVEVHGNLIIEADAHHAIVRDSAFTGQPGFTDAVN